MNSRKTSLLLSLLVTTNCCLSQNTPWPCVIKPMKRDSNYFTGGKCYVIDCKNRNLTSIPNLPQNDSVCKLDLSFNSIKNISNNAFVNVSNLTHLELNNNDFQYIQSGAFEGLFNLLNLSLSNCSIEEIEPNTFSPLTKLEYLDISYNTNLTFTGMNTALYGLRNSSTLKTLDVRAIHSFYGMGTILSTEHVENLGTLTNLTTLHLDMNKIEVINKTIFDPSYMLPTSIRILTVTVNRFAYDEYISHLFKVKNLSHLDLSQQRMVYLPSNHKSSIFSISKDLKNFTGGNSNLCEKYHSPVMFPEYIKHITWRQSFVHFTIPAMLICGADLLESFDLSFNLVTKWIGPIYGLQNLKKIDLSQNNCEYFSQTQFFSSFPKLTNLNISRNILGNIINDSNINASQIFQNQTKLVSLNMSRNDIETLPSDIFLPLVSLRNLDLNGNRLGYFHVALDKAECLETLDLSSNKLNLLDFDMRSQLDRIVLSNCKEKNTLNVNLMANQLHCTCNTLQFLKWMRTTRVIVQRDKCQMQNGEIKNLQTDLEAVIELLDSDCKDHLWIIISLAGLSAFIFSTVLWLIIYKNRWKLRYIYYIRKTRRHANRGFDRLFENDAFISYSSDLALFIKNSLVPALEEEHELKVWVADRDSAAGVSIAENIIHNIASSRKTVLLINRLYIKDDWCDYEMNMASIESIETKRDVMIIVQMEHIPCAEIPIGLLRLLKTKTVLEYPVHSQHLITFWKSLAEEIVS